MASPALYWTTRTITLHKEDILAAAKEIMQDIGMTNINVSAVDTAGRTSTVHGVIVPAKKKDPPSPGSGLGSTAPATYIVFIVAAGADAKAVRDKLGAAWDNLTFL